MKTDEQNNNNNNNKGGGGGGGEGGVLRVRLKSATPNLDNTIVTLSDADTVQKLKRLILRSDEKGEHAAAAHEDDEEMMMQALRLIYAGRVLTDAEGVADVVYGLSSSSAKEKKAVTEVMMHAVVKGGSLSSSPSATPGMSSYMNTQAATASTSVASTLTSSSPNASSANRTSNRDERGKAREVGSETSPGVRPRQWNEDASNENVSTATTHAPSTTAASATAAMQGRSDTSASTSGALPKPTNQPTSDAGAPRPPLPEQNQQSMDETMRIFQSYSLISSQYASTLRDPMASALFQQIFAATLRQSAQQMAAGFAARTTVPPPPASGYQQQYQILPMPIIMAPAMPGAMPMAGGGTQQIPNANQHPLHAANNNNNVFNNGMNNMNVQHRVRVIRIDVKLLLKLALIVFVFNQDGNTTRLIAMSAGAAVYYLYRMGAFNGWINVNNANNANNANNNANNNNNNGNLDANVAAAIQEMERRQQQQNENENNAAQRSLRFVTDFLRSQRGMRREVLGVIIGFFGSLLPSWDAPNLMEDTSGEANAGGDAAPSDATAAAGGEGVAAAAQETDEADARPHQD